MAKNINHIQHVKSNVVENGKPKLPESGVLVEGELAINYAKGYETISLKNASGDIVTFSSDEYYTKQKLGSGFTGENSAVTVTDVIDEVAVGNTAPTNESIEVWIDTSVEPDTVEVYTKAETNALLGNKQDVSGMTNYTTTAVTNDLSAITTAHTADTTIHHSHSNKAVLDSITGTVSSATEVNTALGLKVNTSDIVNEITSGTSASTNPVSVSGVMTVIKENELIISSALNDLETNKLDASAYTPTDLSNYYTKDETSGKTEISTALGTKVNSATFTGHTADTAMHFTTTEKTNLDSLATNIATISGITSTKVSNWDGAATNSHTHSNKTYLDGITGNVGTMAYENKTSYSSATEVNTALSNKADKSTTLAGYGITNAYTKTEIDNMIGNIETLLAAI